MEPGTLQSVATGSGRISLPPSPTGFMTAAKSPAREATTEWVSPSPSEDWTNTHLGTPEGTKKTPGTVSEMTTVMIKFLSFYMKGKKMVKLSKVIMMYTETPSKG